MVLHRIFMRNEKEGIQMQTRREFLKKSAALLGSAAVVGSVPGLLKAQAEDGQEVPAYPYPYVELDPAYVEKLAYEGYFENGCCFGVAKAILVALREKVGYPYTVIPEEMFANGKEGYTCGTLCGNDRSGLRVCGFPPADQGSVRVVLLHQSADLPA